MKHPRLLNNTTASAFLGRAEYISPDKQAAIKDLANKNSTTIQSWDRDLFRDSFHELADLEAEGDDLRLDFIEHANPRTPVYRFEPLGIVDHYGVQQSFQNKRAIFYSKVDRYRDRCLASLSQAIREELQKEEAVKKEAENKKAALDKVTQAAAYAEAEKKVQEIEARIQQIKKDYEEYAEEMEKAIVAYTTQIKKGLSDSELLAKERGVNQLLNIDPRTGRLNFGKAINPSKTTIAHPISIANSIIPGNTLYLFEDTDTGEFTLSKEGFSSNWDFRTRWFTSWIRFPAYKVHRAIQTGRGIYIFSMNFDNVPFSFQLKFQGERAWVEVEHLRKQKDLMEKGEAFEWRRVRFSQEMRDSWLQHPYSRDIVFIRNLDDEAHLSEATLLDKHIDLFHEKHTLLSHDKIAEQIDIVKDAKILAEVAKYQLANFLNEKQLLDPGVDNLVLRLKELAQLHRQAAFALLKVEGALKRANAEYENFKNNPPTADLSVEKKRYQLGLEKLASSIKTLTKEYDDVVLLFNQVNALNDTLTSNLANHSRPSEKEMIANVLPDLKGEENAFDELAQAVSQDTEAARELANILYVLDPSMAAQTYQQELINQPLAHVEWLRQLVGYHDETDQPFHKKALDVLQDLYRRKKSSNKLPAALDPKNISAWITINSLKEFIENDNEALSVLSKIAGPPTITTTASANNSKSSKEGKDEKNKSTFSDDDLIRRALRKNPVEALKVLYIAHDKAKQSLKELADIQQADVATTSPETFSRIADWLFESPVLQAAVTSMLAEKYPQFAHVYNTFMNVAKGHEFDAAKHELALLLRDQKVREEIVRLAEKQLERRNPNRIAKAFDVPLKDYVDAERQDYEAAIEKSRKNDEEVSKICATAKSTKAPDVLGEEISLHAANLELDETLGACNREKIRNVHEAYVDHALTLISESPELAQCVVEQLDPTIWVGLLESNPTLKETLVNVFDTSEEKNIARTQLSNEALLAKAARENMDKFSSEITKAIRKKPLDPLVKEAIKKETKITAALTSKHVIARQIQLKIDKGVPEEQAEKQVYNDLKNLMLDSRFSHPKIDAAQSDFVRRNMTPADSLEITRLGAELLKARGSLRAGGSDAHMVLYYENEIRKIHDKVINKHIEAFIKDPVIVTAYDEVMQSADRYDRVQAIYNDLSNNKTPPTTASLEEIALAQNMILRELEDYFSGIQAEHQYVLDNAEEAHQKAKDKIGTRQQKHLLPLLDKQEKNIDNLLLRLETVKEIEERCEQFKGLYASLKVNVEESLKKAQKQLSEEIPKRKKDLEEERNSANAEAQEDITDNLGQKTITELGVEGSLDQVLDIKDDELLRLINSDNPALAIKRLLTIEDSSGKKITLNDAAKVRLLAYVDYLKQDPDIQALGKTVNETTLNEARKRFFPDHASKKEANKKLNEHQFVQDYIKEKLVPLMPAVRENQRKLRQLEREEEALSKTVKTLKETDLRFTRAEESMKSVRETQKNRAEGLKKDLATDKQNVEKIQKDMGKAEWLWAKARGGLSAVSRVIGRNIL